MNESRSFESIVDLLDGIAAQAGHAPGAVAIRERGGRQVTYAGLVARVERVAGGLLAAGFRRGDPVAFMVRPRIESVVLILATLQLGGVLVAADPTIGDGVFAARLRLVRPRWLMAESFLLALTRLAPVRRALRRRGVALPPLARLVPGARVVTVGPRWPGVPRRARRYERLIAAPPAAGSRAEPAGAPDDPAAIVFTSGTTDRPKGVVHTGASLAATMDLLAAHLALGAGDRVYSAEMHLLVPTLLAGAEAILPAGSHFDPARFLADLERGRVTHAFAVPSDFDRVVTHLSARGERLPATLRAILLGASPVERPFLERYRRVVSPATTVWCVYAMTEILPVAAVTLEEKLVFGEGGDLVGAPFPGIRARIDGGVGEGELVLAGPNLCRGFLGAPPIAEVRTGDLARLDSRGRIVLLGRQKEMIIRGGANIYPALLEVTVARVPGVRAAAFAGVPDADRADERLVLVVEPLPGVDEAELDARLRRELRAGPNSIDLTAFPDAIVFAPLPRAGRSSKLDRRALAALAVGALGTAR